MNDVDYSHTLTPRSPTWQRQPPLTGSIRQVIHPPALVVRDIRRVYFCTGFAILLYTLLCNNPDAHPACARLTYHCPAVVLCDVASTYDRQSSPHALLLPSLFASGAATPYLHHSIHQKRALRNN